MVDSFALYGLLLVLTWLVLQIAALRTLRGGWRLAAWPSAALMGFACTLALLGLLAGSDLAPIWILLALPLCFLWILALWIVRAAVRLVAG